MSPSNGRPKLDTEGISPGLASWLQWLADRVDTAAHGIEELKAEMVVSALWQRVVDDSRLTGHTTWSTLKSQAQGAIAGAGFLLTIGGVLKIFGVI